MTAIQLNLHRVFRANEIGYINKIKPTPEQKNALEVCQRKIRAYLKPVLKEYSFSKLNIGITPRFRVQGSWAYGTCNQPAQHAQEMDLDYGVYLPCAVFGEQRSDESAKEYFAVVETALRALSHDEGWEVDTSKDTCIRLNVMRGAHIDVPLYAVPDAMFGDFEENHTLFLEKASLSKSLEGVIFDSANTTDTQLETIEDLIDLQQISTIHLAKSNGGWKDSDCEKVRKWFNKTFDMC